MTDELSAKMRAYLAEVYRLADSRGLDGSFVGTSDLADLLDVSAPAVNRMINRLKELNLIEHEPYQGVRLTDAGKKTALQQLRKHRITEAFLVRVMSFTWDEVYEEAMTMSTALGEAIIHRMAAMAGAPEFCPHGEPIPDENGTIHHLDDLLLSEAKAGDHVQITRVQTREADRLQYMQALGLVPGTTFDVYHVAPFDGPMQLKFDGEFRIIGHNLAELIRVHVLSNTEE